MNIEGDMIVFEGVPMAKIVGGWPTISERFMQAIEQLEDIDELNKLNDELNDELTELRIRVKELEEELSALENL